MISLDVKTFILPKVEALNILKNKLTNKNGLKSIIQSVNIIINQNYIKYL